MSKTDKIIEWRHASDRSMALAGIETKATYTRHDAHDLAQYVRMLTDLPDYETRAEEAVQLAENTLAEALLAVKLVRSELEKKRHHQLQAAE